MQIPGLGNLDLFLLWAFIYNVGLAILVLVVGYVVSALVGWIVSKIIKKCKVDDYLEKHGRGDAFGGLKASYIIGQLSKWALFSGFIASAAQLINLASVAGVLVAISRAIMALLYATIIILIGLLIADFFADKVNEMKDLPRKKEISRILRAIIIIATVDVAVKTIGINVTFIESLIMVLVAAFAFGTALAIGIAFGLGGKEEAKRILEGVKTKIKKKKE
jgi:MFS family permease